MKILNKPSPKRRKLFTLKCEVCGETFGSYRRTVKTCSVECSKKSRALKRYGLPPKVVCKNGVCVILIKSKFKCIFDEIDKDKIKGKYWSLRRCGGGKMYAQSSSPTMPIVMHRLITNFPKGMSVDHIDGNGLNNRRNNLRVCKNRQNVCYSVSRHGASKFKGVSKSNTRLNPWRAYIAPNRRQISLGFFKTEIEAALAYNKAALKYFGEFALLNDVSSPGQFVLHSQSNAKDHK